VAEDGLTRAYLRDAQLLILDEPTAALDAKAEHEVFQALRRIDARQDGAPDFASIFNREDGGPKFLSWSKGKLPSRAITRVAAPRRALREMFELQAASYR